MNRRSKSQMFNMEKGERGDHGDGCINTTMLGQTTTAIPLGLNIKVQTKGSLCQQKHRRRIAANMIENTGITKESPTS